MAFGTGLSLPHQSRGVTVHCERPASRGLQDDFHVRSFFQFQQRTTSWWLLSPTVTGWGSHGEGVSGPRLATAVTLGDVSTRTACSDEPWNGAARVP
jgi:hypothetical protein